MSDDSGERTEKATEQKLKDAYKKGKVTRSQDFTAWLGIGAASLMMPGAVSAGADAGGVTFVGIAGVIKNPTIDNANAVFAQAVGAVPSILGAMMLAICVTTLLVAIAQGGVHPRGIPAKFEQFNVWNGIKRIFSVQSLWEGAKSLLKTAAIGGALYLVISGLVPVLTASGAHAIARLLDIAAGGISSLLVTAIVVGVLLAIADVFVVMKRNRKHTRMTKKEAKDEHKKMEGDPHVKGQRRARQMEMSRNRMISSVADADVVMVNPTHIAVALKYEAGKSAPRVVAKGSGFTAERIRDKAAEAGVPLVKDITLARALHAACDLGAEIPAELYTSVAHVLVFVDGLRKRGTPRGVHTLPRRKAT